MAQKKLQIKIKKGTDITPGEMEEMYSVRAHFMDLKPEIPREQDFAFFKKTVLAAQRIFLFIAEDGSIKGLYTVEQFIERSNITNKKRLVVEPEFGFILEEYQGKYMAKTVQRNAIRTLFKYPFIPKYLLGPAYPASYFTLKKYGKNVWSWLDKNVPADVKDVLFTYAERHGMVENGHFSGIKSLYTLPKKTSITDLERLEKHREYARYKAQNPDWTKGHGLVTLTKIGFGTLIHQIASKTFRN